ncbi:MAG: flavin-containing monooxygenase [Myxococcaceae bacterium]|nr:flavin-containing monooxygenase [Myxococcaceae bacterium]
MRSVKTNQKTSLEPDHQVLILGTGFAGLGMAIQLLKAGFHDFALVEKEPELGGTWFVNTYPGCACDVQSHMYSFSFEPNPDWSREFATQPEILSYLKRVADKYELRERVQFQTQAIGAEYDEERCLWRVRLAETRAVERYFELRGLKPGDSFPSDDPELPPYRVVTARALVSGIGGLSTPSYPTLPGLERFEGKTFHSQRWDHDYDLRDKRVAVIGTGASAIQFVPEIQPKLRRLDLYQRTPPWILPKPDRAISQLERWSYRNLPGLRQLRRAALYTALESRAIAFAVDPRLFKVAEPVARLYLRSQVRDPALRKKLTPSYSMGCKRVLISNDWYRSLTQPNVEVVNGGIREVRAHSVVDQDGVEREVDAIIFGTGFRVHDVIPRGVFRGRGGADIVDQWPDGPQAFKGTTVSGFPNLFLLLGPNTALGHNSVVYMIEAQINYVVRALEHMRAQELAELEVTQAAQRAFNEELMERSEGTVWTSGGCSSYYLHPVSGRNVAIWPDFTFRFRAATRRFDPHQYRQREAAQLQAPSGAKVRSEPALDAQDS